MVCCYIYFDFVEHFCWLCSSRSYTVLCMSVLCMCVGYYCVCVLDIVVYVCWILLCMFVGILLFFNHDCCFDVHVHVSTEGMRNLLFISFWNDHYS